MKILVTGGAGYIGSVLVPSLLNLGDHEVTVLDNFKFNQNSLMDCCGYPEFEVVRGDCREEYILSKLVAKADVVIPLAAVAGAPACFIDPPGAKSTNVGAIKLLISLMNQDQLLILPSANIGYGKDFSNKVCTEDTPVKPVSLYSKTKMEAEDLALSRENSLVLRLATMFGPSTRMRLDLLVNDFVYKALTDKSLVLFEGGYVRSYLHIHDAVRAFWHAILRFDLMKGNVYNVGMEDTNLTKIQLCEEIKKVITDFVYFQSPINFDLDQRNCVVSNAKLSRTGFDTLYTLQDGIKQLIKCYSIIVKQ